MNVTKQKMISFLAERYSESVQMRGLWLWSEGKTTDIPYSEPPKKHWTDLWALAEKDETPVAPQNLIQEALLDTPGDEFLINCLVSISENSKASIKNDTRLFIEILEYWRSELDFDSVLASLLIFLDCSMRDGVTALVPVLNLKIDEELRDKLEPWFKKIKKEKLTGSVKGIHSLLNFMLDSLIKNSSKIDSEKFHIIAPKVKAHLEKTLKDFEDLSDDDKTQNSKIDFGEHVEVEPKDQALLDALIKELIPLIGSLVEIDPKMLKPIPHTALTAIQRIFDLIKIIANEKKWPWVIDSAEICFKSIWATQAKKIEDETAKNSD
jgi:hypothetical protein